METFWKVALSVAGIGAVGCFVFWSLYRETIHLEAFRDLTKKQRFFLLILVLVFTFLFGIGALVTFLKSRPSIENRTALSDGTALAQPPREKPSVALTMQLDPLMTSVECLVPRKSGRNSKRLSNLDDCATFGISDDRIKTILFGDTEIQHSDRLAYERAYWSTVLRPAWQGAAMVQEKRPNGVRVDYMAETESFFRSFYAWKTNFLERRLIPDNVEWADLELRSPEKALALRKLILGWVGVPDPYFRLTFQNLSASPVVISKIQYSAKFETTYKASLLGELRSKPYVLTIEEGVHEESLVPALTIPANSVATMDLLLNTAKGAGSKFDTLIKFALSDGFVVAETPAFSVIFFRGKE
jgi:hypothetical protein